MSESGRVGHGGQEQSEQLHLAGGVSTYHVR